MLYVRRGGGVTNWYYGSGMEWKMGERGERLEMVRGREYRSRQNGLSCRYLPRHLAAYLSPHSLPTYHLGNQVAGYTWTVL